MAEILPAAGPMAFELFIGRSLAWCLHPSVAWRVLSASGRLVVVAAYFGAGYLGMLTALIVLQ